MTHTVVAKMRCMANEAQPTYSPDHVCHQVRLSAVYDDGDAENGTFSKATPFAELQMAITNPAAIDAFEIGKSYILNFAPADG